MNLPKRSFFLFLSLLLSFTVLFSLGGCSQSASPDGPGQAESSAQAGAEAAPQTDSRTEDSVYVASFQELPEVGFLTDNDPIRDDILYYSLFEFDEANDAYHYVPYALDVNTMENAPMDFSVPDEEFVSKIALLDDGGFALLTYMTEGNGDMRYLYITDETGQTLLKQDVTAALFFESSLDSSGGSAQAMRADSDGNIYVTVSCGFDSYLIVLDAQGQALFTLDAMDCQGLYRGYDGAVYTLNGSNNLQKVDLEAKGFGESLKNLPDTIRAIGENDETTLLISTDNQLYLYDMEAQTSQALLSWIDCNVDPTTISRVSRLRDGRILACTYTSQPSGWYYEAAYLALTPRSQVPEKTTLTYGTLSLDPDISAQIVAFNKASDQYHVEVIVYGDGDFQDGALQLNTAILSGQMPDILDLSTNYINISNLMTKSLLADLRPFIDSDPELSTDDFTENILNYYASGDQIYGLPLNYYICTLVGKTADVGREMGWTMEDIMAFTASLPAEASLIENAFNERILTTMISMGGDRYVDWESGECYFDGEEFINLLTFANSFPGYSDFEWSYETYSNISQGKTKLVELYLYDIFSYQYTAALFDGEPITCIGYPTSEGVGATIIPSQSMGISSQSSCPEGAWAFVRSFLSEEYQSSLTSFFPLREDVLEAMFEDAQKEKEGTRGQGSADFYYEQEPATPEDIATIRQIIDTARNGFGQDATISDIIIEETAPLFAGQKTAQEVAEIIQSRVQIYVSENQ